MDDFESSKNARELAEMVCLVVKDWIASLCENDVVPRYGDSYTATSTDV